MPKHGDLCGYSEIADRWGYSVSAVRNWRMRYEDFPAPVEQLKTGPVFLWADVEAWARAHADRLRIFGG